MHSFRSKPVGWRYEATRHSLAARGFKTKYDEHRYFAPKPSHVFCKNCNKHTRVEYDKDAMKCANCGAVLSGSNNQFFYESHKTGFITMEMTRHGRVEHGTRDVSKPRENVATFDPDANDALIAIGAEQKRIEREKNQFGIYDGDGTLLSGPYNTEEDAMSDAGHLRREGQVTKVRRYNSWVDVAVVGGLIYGGYLYYKKQEKKKRRSKHGK